MAEALQPPDTAPAVEQPPGAAVEAAGWPEPACFEVVPGAEESGPKECAVVFRNGSIEVGRLVKFQPESGYIDFRQTRKPEVRSVRLEAVKLVRLLSPVALRPRELPLKVMGEAVFPERERQDLVLTFFDGDLLQAECYGLARERYGYFVYVAAAGERRALRLFVPTDACQQFALGKPIGEILAEEKQVNASDLEAAVGEQKRRRSKRVGEYLAENAIITREQLERAMQSQGKKPNLRLGEVMVDLGIISQQQLDDALKHQEKNRRVPLGEILVEMEIVDRDTIRRVLASKLGVPFLKLESFQFDHGLLKQVPSEFCIANVIIPVLRAASAVVVATEDPFRFQAFDELKFHLQTAVVSVLADGEDIRQSIDRHYAEMERLHGRQKSTWASGGSASAESAPDIASVAAALDDSEEAEDPSAAIDSALVRLVNKIILDANQQGASDIHIEGYPGKANLRIRFRVDGELRDYAELASRLRQAIVSRIKIMASLDISERRKGQDGKINFARFGPARIELRVATLPTAGGVEDVVLRILSGARAMPMDSLRLGARNLESLQRLALQPHGLLLVCGPTGSGKTTTLHSLLGYLNTPERKILTAEDPVEITQPGLRQVQVNPRIDWGFAEVLRAFLRADPDVIMVGEMRDRETTQIGLEASLTGHLVLSTLHTNSAAESVVRLLDIGVDPFNFADALLGVLGQRLARQLCAKCAQRDMATEEEFLGIAAEYAYGASLPEVQAAADLRKAFGNEKGRVALRRPVGCAECHGTGYKGRIGLHELLVASPAVKHLVRRRAPSEEILAQAVGEGMRTLKQDGIEKVMQGHTDMAQVRATCG